MKVRVDQVSTGNKTEGQKWIAIRATKIKVRTGVTGNMRRLKNDRNRQVGYR